MVQGSTYLSLRAMLRLGTGLGVLCTAGHYTSVAKAAGEDPGDYRDVERLTGIPTPLGCMSPRVWSHAKRIQVCKDEISLLQARRDGLQKSPSGSRASIDAIAQSIIEDKSIIEFCEEELGKPQPTTDSMRPIAAPQSSSKAHAALREDPIYMANRFWSAQVAHPPMADTGSGAA